MSDQAGPADASGDLAALRAEVERLRDLVGPNELSYRQLRDEVGAAGEAARQAELAAGRLRGETVALRFQLARAQPGASLIKRLVPSPLVRWAVVARGWLGRQRRRFTAKPV